MIDPDKVILMTKLAAYEKREQKRDLNAGGYFRGDFIAWELLKGFICANLAFMIGLGILIFSNFDNLLQDIYQIDLVEKGREILGIYGIFMAVFMIGTFIAALFSFSKARKSLRSYSKGLKKLREFYDGD